MTGRYLYRDFTPLSMNICPTYVSKLESFANPHTPLPTWSASIDMSIPGGSGEVIVHQMAYHFPSLPKIAWFRSLLLVVQKGAHMKRTPYDERDYGFGQVMLNQAA